MAQSWAYVAAPLVASAATAGGAEQISNEERSEVAIMAIVTILIRFSTLALVCLDVVAGYLKADVLP
jgi:hypothetical protein